MNKNELKAIAEDLINTFHIQATNINFNDQGLKIEIKKDKSDSK